MVSNHLKRKLLKSFFCLKINYTRKQKLLQLIAKKNNSENKSYWFKKWRKQSEIIHTKNKGVLKFIETFLQLEKDSKSFFLNILQRKSDRYEIKEIAKEIRSVNIYNKKLKSDNLMNSATNVGQIFSLLILRKKNLTFKQLKGESINFNLVFNEKIISNIDSKRIKKTGLLSLKIFCKEEKKIKIFFSRKKYKIVAKSFFLWKQYKANKKFKTLKIKRGISILKNYFQKKSLINFFGIFSQELNTSNKIRLASNKNIKIFFLSEQARKLKLIFILSDIFKRKFEYRIKIQFFDYFKLPFTKEKKLNKLRQLFIRKKQISQFKSLKAIKDWICISQKIESQQVYKLLILAGYKKSL